MSFNASQKRLLTGMLARAAAGFICAVIATSSFAQSTLPPEIEQAWRSTGLPESSLSLQVQEINGPVLFSSNADQARNPASVMKMVTTWSGLLALGPEYRWRTAFMAENEGRIDDQGSLIGPLYIKASGDPMFTPANLWEMLRELRMRGVKNLSKVVVDRSVFGRVAINTAAFDGAGDRPYNASPDAMMIGLGAVRFMFSPDKKGKKWVPVIDPPLPGVRFTGELEWRNGSCPGVPSVGLDINRQGNNVLLNLSGQAASSCGQFSIWRLVLTQDDHFDRLFRLLWRELGGTISGAVESGAVPSSAKAMVWHVSDSVSDVIRQINKQSNNVMARTMLLTIGAELNGPGATPSSAASATMALLRSKGVNTAGWSIENGSGLSRTGRLTANGLAGMLSLAWNSPLMPEFVSSLAISGTDGTLRRRLNKDPASGMAHLKTGTLRDSRALAGYVMSENGKRYILVSMVNHANAIAARKFEDALVNWLVTR